MNPNPLPPRYPLESKDAILHSKDLASRLPFLSWLLIYLFGRRLNRDLLAPVILRARERGVLDYAQCVDLLSEFDPTQAGAIGFVVGAEAIKRWRDRTSADARLREWNDSKQETGR